MFSFSKQGKFWRTDWFAGVLVVLAVAGLHLATDVISTLERRFYDFASTSTSRQPSERIAFIAIDDLSIANIGRWPWSRDIDAKLIDQLAAAKAKTIVNTAFFFEPQVDRSLSFIRKMKSTLGAPGNAAGLSPATNEKLAGIITEAEAALDTDFKLASSMTSAGNVLLPSFFSLGQPLGKPDTPLPDFALKTALNDLGFSVSAIRGQQPISALGTAAAGVGHLNQTQDRDGAMRQEILLVDYYGKAVPSLALLTAANSLNLTIADIKLNAGESVQVGKLKIKTDAHALMLPQFYVGQNGKPAFAPDSYYDVLTGKIPASKYAGKIVIIGATAPGVGTQFPVPGYPALSPGEAVAHVASSILNEHFIVQPGWGTWATLAIVLLVAGYIIAALPRLSAGMAATITAGLFAVLLGAEFGLLSASALWLKLIFPATLLLIGHLALTSKRFLMTEAGKQKSDDESAETSRMMGLALQGQGQLDMAFDRFRRVPLADNVMGNLFSLALDFERKRQFNKAQSVYEHMATFDPNYKDLKSKLNRAKNLSETVMLGGGTTHPGGSMLLADGSVEKPMLGRYQVEKELGKGAMGVVYLGKDPKIGRVVAIKTMALGQEFEGDELVDARERFFREAETAGRLQHQNIVTIFDAGEEHDLAYIAMEFLKGKDLVESCKEGQLLPVPTVISIVARVAEALSYAHRQNVVHRDIKPANIMYELASDTVKVTDFGIARITDSSKTKTGMVLGTPSFMSPEQLAGKKVDGRSDLYSLGVMLYQLLAGVLPFRGDSMAELMYKISSEAAPDIRVVRAELHASLASLVAFSLAKRPEDRYQDGERFAADLRALLPLYGAVVAQPVAPAASIGEETIVLPRAKPVQAPAPAPMPPLGEDFEKTLVNVKTMAEPAKPQNATVSVDLGDITLPGFMASAAASPAMSDNTAAVAPAMSAPVPQPAATAATPPKNAKPPRKPEAKPASQPVTAKSGAIKYVAAGIAAVAVIGIGIKLLTGSTEPTTARQVVTAPSASTPLNAAPPVPTPAQVQPSVPTPVVDQTPVAAAANNASAPAVGQPATLPMAAVSPAVTASAPKAASSASAASAAARKAAAEKAKLAALAASKPVAPVVIPEKVEVAAPVAAPAPPPVAPPVVKPQPAVASNPEQACEGRWLIAYQNCMAEQCAKPSFGNHAVCVERKAAEQRRKDAEQARGG